MSRMARWISRAWLSGGYFFLYLPIVVLIVFSFNSSRQDMIWTGFSLQWYAALAQDRENYYRVWLVIAAGAVYRLCLGGTGHAGPRLRWTAIAALPAATLFGGMVSAPLVMPEVIIGLSLLLTLVSMQKLFGFPERGVFTMWLGPHPARHGICHGGGAIAPAGNEQVTRRGRHGFGLPSASGIFSGHLAQYYPGTWLGLVADLYPVT